MSDECKQQSDDETFQGWKIALVFALVLLCGLLFGVIPWVTFYIRPEWAMAFPDKAGLWGDSFGFVNAMLSALAFAGILLTLWMQRRELQLQRDEMRLTREELEATRAEHSRMAKSQEGSENRLFLAAYMNALESLRQLSQWRMTADPAVNKIATFPVVEGLVVQARVSQSLQILVRDLEPEIRQIHPALSIVTEDGSWVWRLEQLLNVYISLRTMLESNRGRSDDPLAFEEAANIAQLQMNRLKELKAYLGNHRHHTLEAIIEKAPDSKGMAGDTNAMSVKLKEYRKRYFAELENANKELLSFIMAMCHE